MVSAKRDERMDGLEAEIGKLVEMRRRQQLQIVDLTADAAATSRRIRALERNLKRLLNGRP